MDIGTGILIGCSTLGGFLTVNKFFSNSKKSVSEKLCESYRKSIEKQITNIDKSLGGIWKEISEVKNIMIGLKK